MPNVRDILLRKGREVISVTTSTTVQEAAHLMNQRSIGGVVVMEAGRLVGIFTERDIMRRVVAEERDPANTQVGELMTRVVVTCTLDTSIEDCGSIMTSRRIRHLPVMGPDGLCGVVTSGDVLAFQVAEQQATIAQLNSYVFDVR
jgi:CBS domain-containing protein